jgi:DNA-directed RNA polymerase specialized sigma24 family protein
MEEYAWEELLGLYNTRLRRDIIISLHKRGLAAALADDIQQQTWTTAVQKIHLFDDRGEEKLYRWLRAISVNHVRSLQHQQDTAMMSNEGDGGCLARGCYAEATEQTIIRREQLAAVYLALSRLKPQARNLVIRCLLWGEKPEELTAMFPHLKARSISQALFRAKRQIRTACAGAEAH